MYLIDSLPKRYLVLSSSFVKLSIVKKILRAEIALFLSFPHQQRHNHTVSLPFCCHFYFLNWPIKELIHLARSVKFNPSFNRWLGLIGF